MTTLGADDDTSSFLERVLDRVPGLQLLAVYDREAVLIAKAARTEPDAGANAALVAVFAVLAEQASKLQFGKNKHITAFYKDRIVVHINCLPLVISAVAAPNANIGLLLSLQQDLRTALEPLRQVAEKASEGNAF